MSTIKTPNNMKAIKYFSLLICLVLIIPAKAQYTAADVEAYVDKYKDYAIQAMEKYHIPASIKLAQAIYSSACGTNRAAIDANNHFGIMCSGGWTGETFYYENAPQDVNHCFRKYKSVEASYQNHSVFLTTRARYAELFKLEVTDYKGWANGLYNAGYTANKSYPQRLINLIENYNLDRFDQPSTNEGRKVINVEIQEATPAKETIPVKEPEITFEKPKPADNGIRPTEQEKTEIIETEYTTSIREKSTPKQKTKTVEEKAKDASMDIKAKPKEDVPVANVKSKHEEKAPAILPKTEPKEKAPATPSSTPVKVNENLPAPKQTTPVTQTIFTATENDFRQIYYPYSNRPVYENNKTSFVIAKAGDTFAKIARETKLTETYIRLYNDIFDDKYEPIPGEVVYLENKNTKSATDYHTMKQGESFRYISQKYAIQLKTLLKRNGYAPGVFGIGDKVCVNCK